MGRAGILLQLPGWPSMFWNPASHMSMRQSPLTHTPLALAGSHRRPYALQFKRSARRSKPSPMRPLQSLSMRSHASTPCWRRHRADITAVGGGAIDVRKPGWQALTIDICFILFVSIYADAGAFDDFFSAIRVDDASSLQSLLKRGFDQHAQSKGLSGLYLALRELSPNGGTRAHRVAHRPLRHAPRRRKRADDRRAGWSEWSWPSF